MTPKPILSPSDTAKTLVRRIVESITVHHDKLKVSASALGRSSLKITVELYGSDFGRTMGTKGAHKEGIETVAQLIARKNRGLVISVRFAELGGERDPREGFSGRDTWDSGKVLQLSQDIADAIFDYPAKVELSDGDDYESVIEFLVSPRETEEIIEYVKSKLSALYSAIGMRNGRILTINVLPEGSF